MPVPRTATSRGPIRVAKRVRCRGLSSARQMTGFRTQVLPGADLIDLPLSRECQPVCVGSS
jgi:hypothetical protein